MYLGFSINIDIINIENISFFYLMCVPLEIELLSKTLTKIFLQLVLFAIFSCIIKRTSCI